MKANKVSALRSKRGLRRVSGAEPQVVGLTPQTTMKRKANTMKTYILVRHHLVALCHTVSAAFGHRTVNPPASERTIRPARECGVTSVGLLLVFTVSIKLPSLTIQV